ncbi:repressor LexA [Haliangium sp. UPWRP_2]|nr:repressor LexA [Haliangium sp. UPWRP_2]
MRHSDGKNGHSSSSGGSSGGRAGRGKGRSATGSLGRPPRTAAASDGGGAIRKRPAVGVAGAVDDEGEGRGDRLTDRQRQVLQYISQSIHSRGYPPTLREIGQHMQIRSTNGVNDHLRALEKKGYLERHDLKSRALRVKEPSVGATGPETDDRDGGLRRAAGQAMVTAAAALSQDVVEVPLLGRVAAGQPILAIEQREDTVQVDRFFLGNHRDVFALRVKGDSMIEAGIHDGDYLFVKKQSVARPGDIVVAMINDEATVKYFYPERDRIVFKPANSRLLPIEVKKSDFKPVNLLGTVVGIYRRIN